VSATSTLSVNSAVCFAFRAHYHAAMRGVFHSVANADASRIHRLVVKDQCQPFYFNAWTVQLRANAEQVVQTGKTSSPAPHPRFDLRDLQHIVNQARQVFTVAIDDIQILPMSLRRTWIVPTSPEKPRTAFNGVRNS
jgi:hypothetical protein